MYLYKGILKALQTQELSKGIVKEELIKGKKIRCGEKMFLFLEIYAMPCKRYIQRHVSTS